MMACPVALAICITMIAVASEDDSAWELIGAIGLLVALVAYILARFILLFLLVYSFWSLPAGVYDATSIGWLNFIPFLH